VSNVIWQSAVLSPLMAANGFVWSGLPSNDGSFDPYESAPKWHFDWFSYFCTTYLCAQHTNRQTHRPRYVWHL